MNYEVVPILVLAFFIAPFLYYGLRDSSDQRAEERRKFPHVFGDQCPVDDRFLSLEFKIEHLQAEMKRLREEMGAIEGISKTGEEVSKERIDNFDRGMKLMKAEHDIINLMLDQGYEKVYKDIKGNDAHLHLMGRLLLEIDDFYGKLRKILRNL